MKSIVIVGGGFGGLAAAKTLAKKSRNTKISVIDAKNHHLFQPLLYQVATAGLSPADIAVPIRSVLNTKSNAIDVTMEYVDKIDAKAQTLTLRNGQSLSYDVLLLACGSTHSYFGHPEWEEFAPGLKTLEQATEIRRRILEAFEKAESSKDENERRELLTFAIVGGGPTGVELAGAIAEISRKTLSKDFTRIDPSNTRIVLIEAGSRILAAFSEKLSKHATRDLERMGVSIWSSTRVTNISDKGVHMGDEFLRSKTVIWAAGVQPSPICRQFPNALDSLGRLKVDNFLRVQGYVNIFAIGDMAHFLDSTIGILPGLAPVAMQQGRHAARNIIAMLAQNPLIPFQYNDKGKMATIGRRTAVSEFRGFEWSGPLAWYGWLVIHIYYLIGFRTKIFVLLQWFSSYFFFKRGARLITGKEWKIFS
ncbi:MAG: NAD(P)/FAD-dependent oxidoreductase [Proteobacteria bacterium]|nr:NAD(P)/FAD-dependent oxidoreductase [Pseudomonadota bacterium]